VDNLGDAELIIRVHNGDSTAYKTLVTRYQGHVYGLAYSIVDNWADAQDLAQETFIRAYTNLDQLHDPAKFAAWLRRVTFGVTMNWLKAYRPQLFQQIDGKIDLDALEVPDFRAGPAQIAEGRELADAVMQAVAGLPPKYRVPLTMFHLDGLSYQKVADFLDIPLGTAKSLIHRAQQRLKAALGAAVSEEVTPMVQEVFNEHKLPAGFAGKVLEKVPALGWERGKECTFVGALEAALAATACPCSYTNLMGFTGLAFRVRWWKPTKEIPQRWCASSAVGEMDEEILAAERATGWPMRVEFHPDERARQVGAPGLVASIDAGRPVLAYDGGLNMGVVYGYASDGQTILFQGYDTGEKGGEMPARNLGWMWLYLGEHRPGSGGQEAVRAALALAVNHWRRGSWKTGPGEYWYGRAALERWRADLLDVSGLDEKQLKSLFHVNSFNYRTLRGGRR